MFVIVRYWTEPDVDATAYYVGPMRWSKHRGQAKTYPSQQDARKELDSLPRTKGFAYHTPS
jgi:hypothetical protein